MIMRRVDAGEDVFADLRHYENATMIRPPHPLPSHPVPPPPPPHPRSSESVKMYQGLTPIDQGAVQILLMLHKNTLS
jgi:hypothetical protein